MAAQPALDVCPADLAVPSELFVIEDGDQFLLYAPFTRGVASVDAATARRFQDARDGKANFDDFDPGYLAALVDAGLLTTKDRVDERPTFPTKTAFDPEGLTLFLTTKCNLGCTYCYASANERPSVMTLETAQTAIDWIVDHTAARGRTHFRLMFHGGGEATVAFDVLRRSLAYARDRAAARGMQITASAGLNGVMKGPVLEWIIANLDNATVSLDGLPDIHDAQRPLLNGKGSFDIVAAAILRMDDARFQYGLRVTVTSTAVPRLVEAVTFMCERFKCAVIALEPVSSSGRAKAQDAIAPGPLEFIREYRAALAVARRYGRELTYSGARFGSVSNGFCETTQDLLAVTAEGFLSSCYEVGQRDDPRSGLFFYGRLDAASRNLDVDMKKVIRLRTLSVEHKVGCDSCFCRWTCAGECAAKLAEQGDPWHTGHSSRCTINRALTLGQMKDYLDGIEPISMPKEMARL